MKFRCILTLVASEERLCNEEGGVERVLDEFLVVELLNQLHELLNDSLHLLALDTWQEVLDGELLRLLLQGLEIANGLLGIQEWELLVSKQIEYQIDDDGRIEVVVEVIGQLLPPLIVLPHDSQLELLVLLRVSHLLKYHS